MTLETHIDQARTRVSDERTHVARKRDAFGEFERRVRELSTANPGASSGPAEPSGELFTATNTTTASVSAAGRSCQAVCEAFAETIHPYSTADIDGDALVETIRGELGDDIAVALAPKTGGQFTATTKQAILAKAGKRTTELDVMLTALEKEATSLRSVAERTETVTEWLVEANETPLTELGFDALQTRHETLATHRTRCDEMSRDRQAFLDGTTSNDGDAGINHRTLAAFLYEKFPVEYPGLATAVRLNELCETCQRVVRDHLVRRV